MKIINCKIDATKIDKERLYHAESGAKYLDFTVMLKDEPDQYGNFGMIVQDITKEERESGQQATILGNVKRVYDKQAGQGSKPPQKQASAPKYEDDNLLPF